MTEDWKRIRLGNAKKIIGSYLKYNKAALVNYDQLDGDTSELYVLPIFLPPNKNDFMIRTPRDMKV